MGILDSIKNSIESNQKIDKNIKMKLFELSIIFHDKFPNVSLDRFNNLVKDVEVDRIGKYEVLGTSHYDVRNNKIMISPNRIKNIDYNMDNIFMRMVLSMITSNGKYSGFNSDPQLKSLNSAYEESIANYLVGSSEVSDQEEEILITNIIGSIIGNDKLYDAYFSNDSKYILDCIEKLEMKDVLNETNHLSESKQGGLISSHIYANILNKLVNSIEKGVSLRIIVNPEQIENAYASFSDSSNGLNDSLNHVGVKEVKERLRNLMGNYGIVVDNFNNDLNMVSIKQKQ